MIRNGDVEGILTWCTEEVWEEKGKVLVLDYYDSFRKTYSVFYLNIHGDETEKHTFDCLSEALIHFAQQLPDYSETRS